MANTYGREFWPWFLVGKPLPLIANVILLCLPDKTKQKKDIKKNEINLKI